jgi:hypothetical protein
MTIQGIKRDKKQKVEVTKNTIKKKITPEIEKYIKENAGKMGDPDFSEKIEEEFGVKIHKDTIKDYRKKNGLPGIGKGRKKKEDEDLEFPSEEDYDKVSGKKKKEEIKPEFPEIEKFVIKSKTTDPYTMRDKIIEKFEKDLPIAKRKIMIGKRLDSEERESEPKRIEKLQQEYEEDDMDFSEED